MAAALVASILSELNYEKRLGPDTLLTDVGLELDSPGMHGIETALQKALEASSPDFTSDVIKQAYAGMNSDPALGNVSSLGDYAILLYRHLDKE